MNGDDRFDERITRLLAASHASANPAVLERARARLAERESASGFLAFLGRPVALATAAGLLVVSIAASLAIVSSERAATAVTTATATQASGGSLVAALLDDDGTYGLPAELASSSVNAPSDAGSTGSAGQSSDSNGVTP
ncbi:MAG: hypothetical protein HZA61_02220 [Candidatus Eisenbacteria bacterium]|uniref:Uncharacterized protein n=1 Tax=Eiseniibacteriota bacterium TaxID=2212470 RepID=A0A933W7C5_UNCEI|nr:hypothetical protein [Candidatus Eisenbacteria bacterium]